MKFLEIPALTRLNNAITAIDTMDTKILGRLEAYSCKTVGTEKKLFKALEHQVVEEITANSPTSPIEYAFSPFGPLSEASSRKTFIYLISILNSSYPDYDFSNIRPEQFRKEINTASIEDYTKIFLGQAIQNSSPELIDEIWDTINEEIDLKDCSIYSLIAEPDSGPFGEAGVICSFNYFFYNKKLKRILYFSCRSVSKMSVLPAHSMNDDEEEEEGDDTRGWTYEDGVYDDIEMEAMDE